MSHFITVYDENIPGLNPMQFGYEKCKKSHSYGPAIRTYWLFHFVVSGYGTFEIENKKYKVRPGEMFVIPPWIETYYYADNSEPWEYIWIGFYATDKLPHKTDDVMHLPSAFPIFNSMKKCEHMTGGRSTYLASKLWELFALMKESRNVKPDYIQTALECIHSEYMNPITVEDISERLNLNRTYFSNLFKLKTGVSPKKYLLNYRMNMAKKLLVKKEISITVVAYSVGYTDVFNFSKMFKKIHKISPREFQKKQAAPAPMSRS